MSNLPTPKPELESVLQRRKKNLGEVIAYLAQTGLSKEQIEESLKAQYSIPEATMKAIDKHFIEAQVHKASVATKQTATEEDSAPVKKQRKPKPQEQVVSETEAIEAELVVVTEENQLLQE